MKNQSEEKWCHDHLGNEGLWQVLARFDADLAEKAQAEGCGCGGNLHRANYPRKPRGGPQWGWRDSFCCAEEGCRRRRTPPSVRFLGRRVYVGLVVVLLAAMRHGLKPGRVDQIRAQLGVDERTLERWRRWWLSTFRAGRFWQAAKGRLMPPVEETALPLSLAERFGVAVVDGVVQLLAFLAPLTTR